MENITDSSRQTESIDSAQDRKLPLHPKRIRDLFFSPSRFFKDGHLDWSPYYLLVIWIVGVSATLDRFDTNMVRADLGSPRPGQEIITGSWVGFWLVALLIGTIGGSFIWLVGGWWYRVRLNWSGDSNADNREARLVYIYASLVSALPNVLMGILLTLLFDNYGAYWSSEEIWSSLLIVFPFWSVVVSYKGVMATFDVRPGKAQLWFLWLPIGLFILGFSSVVVMYILS